MSSLNWGLLYEQGRCKAFGVPWTEEELRLIYELHIPVDFVRNGCTTLEEYEIEKAKVEATVQATGSKPLKYMTKEELMELAEDMEIPSLTPDVKRFELIHLIKVAQEKKAESILPPPAAGSQES